MDEYKKTINTLQERNVKVLQCLSRMLMSNSLSLSESAFTRILV